MYFEYLKLGLEHILDPNGLDHILFLIVLAIPFSLKEWKTVLVLATAFTLGHSFTLLLSGLDIIRIYPRPVEIAIAVSIFLTAAYNLFAAINAQYPKARYLAALVFGLIHGLGFSNFFRSILGGDSITLPLLCFNVGVEVAQLIVVIILLLINFLVIEIFKIQRKHWVIGVSVLIMIWSFKLILER